MQSSCQFIKYINFIKRGIETLTNSALLIFATVAKIPQIGKTTKGKSPYRGINTTNCVDTINTLMIYYKKNDTQGGAMDISMMEAMKQLGVGRTTLQKWLKAGEIKHTKQINNRIMVDVESLTVFILGRTKGNDSNSSRRDV